MQPTCPTACFNIIKTLSYERCSLSHWKVLLQKQTLRVVQKIHHFGDSEGSAFLEWYHAMEGAMIILTSTFWTVDD